MGVRPIVYSARYFYPGKRVSHWHLYRMTAHGKEREQLTWGIADDFKPVWSPSGKWIAFVRSWQNGSQPTAVCLVSAEGGVVRTLYPMKAVWGVHVEWLSDTRLFVCCRKGGESLGYVLPVHSGKPERLPCHTEQHALSPGKSHLVGWPSGAAEGSSALIVRLKDGHSVALPQEVGASVAWLDDQHFVAKGYSRKKETFHLSICSTNGQVLRTEPLQLDVRAKSWLVYVLEKLGLDKELEYSPAFIDAYPGRSDSVLVGWQLGGSRDGRWAATYQVNIKTGKMVPWAVMDSIVPSPDKRYFITTRPPELVEIPGSYGSEWGTPLLLGEVANPQNQVFLVSGRVHVAGFDWRH